MTDYRSVLGDRHYIVLNLATGAVEDQNRRFEGPAPIASNSKMLALAFIQRINPRYLQENIETRPGSRVPGMRYAWSLSHNDAVNYHVARAMGRHDVADALERSFRPFPPPYTDRSNDNIATTAHWRLAQNFFQEYQQRIQRTLGPELGDLSMVADPVGAAYTGRRVAPTSTTLETLARAVKLVHDVDNGQTLNRILDPTNPRSPHTALAHLGQFQGSVLYAKTGSIQSRWYDRIPASSAAHRQFPEGIFTISIGYRGQDGQPRLLFFHDRTIEERRSMAQRFLQAFAARRQGMAPDPSAEQHLTRQAEAPRPAPRPIT